MDSESVQFGVVDEATRPVSVFVEEFQAIEPMFVLVGVVEDVQFDTTNVQVIGQVEPLYEPYVGALAVAVGVAVVGWTGDAADPVNAGAAVAVVYPVCASVRESVHVGVVE